MNPIVLILVLGLIASLAGNAILAYKLSRQLVNHPCETEPVPPEAPESHVPSEPRPLPDPASLSDDTALPHLESEPLTQSAPPRQSSEAQTAVVLPRQSAFQSHDDTAFPPLFHAAASALDVGLVVVNNECQIHFLNAKAEELLATRVQTALGQGLITLLRDYQADALVREVIRDGENREATIHQMIDNRTLRLHCAPLLPNGNPGGALLLIRDMTQINMLERSRRDLVANVSHELRTPLASLKLLVETLQSDPPPQVAQRMLGQMSQEIDAVTQLVDELHELSQIESGRVVLTLEPSSITTVVERALHRIHPQAKHKQLYVQSSLADHSPDVLMDASRVGQVMLNLLHNAVKFTASGGRLRVSTQVMTVDGEENYLSGTSFDGYEREIALHADKLIATVSAPMVTVAPIPMPSDHPSGAWMVVCINDTGIGIPAQELPRIFERFYKVDRSRNRHAGGTGLGLAIAKHLVEGHGGRLWARSVEGQGSTFYFSLPLA